MLPRWRSRWWISSELAQRTDGTRKCWHGQAAWIEQLQGFGEENSDVEKQVKKMLMYVRVGSPCAHLCVAPAGARRMCPGAWTRPMPGTYSYVPESVDSCSPWSTLRPASPTCSWQAVLQAAGRLGVIRSSLAHGSSPCVHGVTSSPWACHHNNNVCMYVCMYVSC